MGRRADDGKRGEWIERLRRREEYNRFLKQQPATLRSDDRHRIGALAETVSQVWNAEGTSAIDRNPMPES